VSQATSSTAVSSSVSLLGIAGLRVLSVFEFVDERHVFVETVRDFDACRGAGSGPSRAADMSPRSAIFRLARRRPG